MKRLEQPDPRWEELFPDQAALDEYVGRWQVGDAVPQDMTAVLQVTRRLLVDSYHEYEYALVAATWSLLALEAALHVCLGAQGSQRLSRMIKTASEQGLIAKEECTAIDGARKLRNTIVHGSLRPTFSPAAAVEMVGAIHDAISDIYDRAVRETTDAR